MSAQPLPCLLPTEKRNLKRKDPSSLDDAAAIPSSITVAAAPTKNVTPPKDKGNSPYDTRMTLMKEYQDSELDDYVIWKQWDVLESIPNRMEELEVEEVEELTEAKWKEALSKVTLKEVDEHFNVMLVRKEMTQHIDKFSQEIDNADPRGLYVMNTATSNYMTEVILVQLQKVKRSLNKVIKDVKKSTNGVNTIVPGVARDAFERTYGAIFACDAEDHWRNDTENPHLCEMAAKSVTELLKNILWFHDEELGLIDPFSRKSLLNRFKKLVSDWESAEIEQDMTFATPKNGNGMGRSLDDVPSPKESGPASKKPKTVALSVGGVEGGNDSSRILAHLNALGDKLSLRTNTVAQLKITDASGKKSCQVVCSGSISLKKVGQLVAFLTNHSSEYEYHIQRGRSLKGSYFELSLDGESRLLLGENALKKKAKAEGVGYAQDKPIKIVQVFQGLIVKSDSGMIFESESNRGVSLVWVSDKGDRYSVTAQGILPNKCVSNRTKPMPRLVDEDYNNSRKRTDFGKSIRMTNTILRGDRKASRASIYWIGVSYADVKKFELANLGKPVCLANGLIDEIDGSYEWKAENVRAAGPPSSFS